MKELTIQDIERMVHEDENRVLEVKKIQENCMMVCSRAVPS